MRAVSTRDTYPPGVPCWVETLQPDPAAAHAFYRELFGWELAGSPEYTVARLGGRDVAGIAPLDGSGFEPGWITHIRVKDVDAAVRDATAAGATVALAAMDADPAGRLAALRDPTGALFAVWEAAWREGAELVNEPGAWAMSTLVTGDTAAAGAFYGTVFGWGVEPYGPASLFRLPGYVGGEPAQPVPRDVVAVMAPGEGPATWAVDFWVADAEATVALAERLGGRVLVAPHDRPPAFRNAVIADPAGAVLSVSQLLG